MCNHYQNLPGAEKFLPTWKEFIGFDMPAELPDFANDVYPKRHGLVLRIDAGEVKADAMMWGVPCQVPGKRPGTKLTKHVTNVRNLASPFWRSMLKDPARRCLVPFSSFAEPVIGGGRAEHWFTIRDRPLAAFAGIWRPTEEGRAFAFLTCEPNPLVAPLHPRPCRSFYLRRTIELGSWANGRKRGRWRVLIRHSLWKLRAPTNGRGRPRQSGA